MRGEELGIVLSQPELALLLAHVDKKSRTLDCVAFSADHDTVRAFASDGTCAVAGIGENDDVPAAGQWRVVLPFLEKIKKAIGTKDFVRLQFNGASLTEAAVLELIGEGEECTLEERQTITWHEDACDQQLGFPFERCGQVCEKFYNDSGVPQLVAPRFVKRLGLMANLHAASIEIRSGRQASDGLMAIATTSDDTEWVCRIMPCGEEAVADQKKDQLEDAQQELTA